MEHNHLQLHNTHNASFPPNPPYAANQQQGANPQSRPIPPLANAPDLYAHPPGRNLHEYNIIRPIQEGTDSWSLPEYQPIKPGEPYLEKLADEAANTKKGGMLLKHAQEYEAEGDFKDAEKAYKKALKYTENAEHYKAYAGCLREIYRKLSQVPLTPEKDEAKERTYKEKAARAFYYLGDLYQKQGAWKEAQAAYQASCDLTLYELPLKALVDVAQHLGEAKELAAALEKLADFYIEKGATTLAIDKLKEAFEIGKAAKILEKLDALYGKAGGEDSQSQRHEIAIQRFELQLSHDPKNIGLYRDYAWFLKSIGRQDEARAVKKRIDGLLQQNVQTLQQKVIEQETKIGNLKQTIHLQARKLETLGKQVEFLEEQTFSLDFRFQTNIQDEYLIYLLNKNPYIRLLNLENCKSITDAGLAPLKGLNQLTSLNLGRCDKLTDAGLQHLRGLTQLTSLSLNGCKQLTDAGLQHLAHLTQLTSLNLSCYDIYDSYNSQLTDTGLRHLAGLTQLTSLNLGSCDKLTDAGLQHLAGLSQLTLLDLSRCDKLTDAGLQHLAGLSQLTSLGLHGCTQLRDGGLQHLAGLTQLTSLNLNGCKQLRDAGLQHLAGITQLTLLQLYSCKQLTSNAKEHLKRQIPGLKIIE